MKVNTFGRLQLHNDIVGALFTPLHDAVYKCWLVHAGSEKVMEGHLEGGDISVFQIERKP